MPSSPFGWQETSPVQRCPGRAVPGACVRRVALLGTPHPGMRASSWPDALGEIRLLALVPVAAAT